MPLTKEQQDRLDRIAPVAVAAERRRGYPPEVLIAQWAIETGWGKKVSAPGNLFGMKYVRGRHKDFVFMWTPEEVTWPQMQRFPEVERKTAIFADTRQMVTGPYDGDRELLMRCQFAKYGSPDEGVDDYLNLISGNPRYAAAWGTYQRTRNWRDLVKGLAAAGYATASNYADVALSIGASREVTAAIAAARSTAKSTSTKV